jgi:hypothetical protein
VLVSLPQAQFQKFLRRFFQKAASFFGPIGFVDTGLSRRLPSATMVLLREGE